ncbi:MAG: hypothetical protein ACOY3P_23705 [Planctomycetota bacterium]
MLGPSIQTIPAGDPRGSHGSEPLVVVLFRPTRALLDQFRDATRQAEDAPFTHVTRSHVTPTKRTSQRGRALPEHADLAIVDLSRLRGTSLKLLEQALERFGPCFTWAYSESPSPQLELAVRQRGVLLFLGPMQPTEWNDQLRHVARRLDVVPQREVILHIEPASAAGGFRPIHLPSTIPSRVRRANQGAK